MGRVKTKTWLSAFCIFLLYAALFLSGFAREPFVLIDDFEAGLKTRWEKKIFEGETRYTVIKMDGSGCLKAESHASASGLIYKIKYDTRDYPVLTWRWKVENILQKGDERTRQGDDYAARVYVVFPHFIPALTRSINYIWANKLPRGERCPNPYYSRAMMIAVESGEKKVGTWVTEKRNVFEDYRTCFGKDPSYAGAIAIMTDTDNTGESAVAYYDDIKLETISPTSDKPR